MPGAPRLKGDPVTSPFVFDSGEDANGKHLTARFTFNEQTRNLNNVNIHRDPGCLYSRLFIGLGPDGTPNASPFQFTNDGSQVEVVFSRPEVVALGLSTIEDVLALGQITAG